MMLEDESATDKTGRMLCEQSSFWSCRLMVRPQGFHPCYSGSNPGGTTTNRLAAIPKLPVASMTLNSLSYFPPHLM